MDPTNKKLIVGNWKMYNNITDSIKLVTALKNLMGELNGVEPVVAPPFPPLYSVSVAIQDTPLKLAGQNCHWEDEGPFTGEVSAAFLKDLGCDYVILGHSERREHFGEKEDPINKKSPAALNEELIPIFCVGETLKERKDQKTFLVIEQQIRKGLIDVAMHDLENFVIAYEPVWAIGTGETATPAQAGEVHSHIRAYLTKLYDAPTANRVKLLYGGSVKAENIVGLMRAPHMDGALVGGASLDPEQFAKIVRSCNHVD